MDGNRRNPGGYSEGDDVEFIDATSEDIIEIIDPYESEVIEIKNAKNAEAPKKKTGGYVPPTPKGPVQTVSEEQYNASSTVILHKGEGEAKKEATATKTQEAPKSGVVPPLSNGPSRAPQGGAEPPRKKQVSVPPTGPIPDMVPPKQTQSAPRPNYNTAPKSSAPTGSSGSRTASAGAERTATPSQNRQSGASSHTSRPRGRQQSSKQGFNIPLTPRTVGIAAVAVVALIVIIIMMIPKKVTIKLNDYTTVNFSGYNGSGKAEVVIDYDKINSDYGSKIKVNDGSSLKDVIEACVKYDIDIPSEGLSNGKIVTVKFTIDDSAFSDKTDGALKSSEVKVFAKDLLNSADYNVFDDIQVEIGGYSTVGTAKVTIKDGCALPGIIATADKSENLKNGDTVTVTVSAPDGQDLTQYCAENGCILTETSKTYEVSGLLEYEIYDLFDKITVSYSGLDGLGTVSIDTSKVDIEGLNYVASKDSKLSNGDKIKISVNAGSENVVDKLAALKYGVGKTEMEYTVAGLVIPEEYDPYAELVISYVGSGPNAGLAIDASKVSISGLTFTADKTEKINNGDVITISVSGAGGLDANEICLGMGKKLVSNTYSFTATGLQYYLDNTDVITEDFKDKIDAQGQNIIKTVYRDLMNQSGIKTISLDSLYLEVPKNENVILTANPALGGMLYNKLYVVYNVEVSFMGNSLTYVWPILFANVIVDGDGNINVNVDKYSAGLNAIEINGYNYYGFNDIEEFEASLDEAGAYKALSKKF